MERVSPNYHLTRWTETNPYPITPHDVYKTMMSGRKREEICASNFGIVVHDIYNELLSHQDKVTLNHVACVMVNWLVTESFDEYHIGAITRVTAKALTDLLEVPENGQILYFPYTVRSYSDIAWIEKTYGDRIVTLDEMRDSGGVLKQYRVVLKP